MKKNIIVVLTIFLGIFVGGCAKKIEKPILFDNYSIALETKYNYKEIATDTTQGSPAIKRYIQEIQTGFVGSIIITKTQIQTGIDLSAFATNNSKSLSRKITKVTKTSTDKLSFECNSKKIDGILQEITIKEGEQKQYLNQLFFIENNDLYGISTITTERKENKNLAKSIEKISCSKTIDQ